MGQNIPDWVASVKAYFWLNPLFNRKDAKKCKERRAQFHAVFWLRLNGMELDVLFCVLYGICSVNTLSAESGNFSKIPVLGSRVGAVIK